MPADPNCHHCGRAAPFAESACCAGCDRRLCGECLREHLCDATTQPPCATCRGTRRAWTDVDPLDRWPATEVPCPACAPPAPVYGAAVVSREQHAAAVARAEAAERELASTRAALRGLLTAMPRCQLHDCDAAATHEDRERDDEVFCDAHAPAWFAESLPHAPAIRAALAALGATA
jgi:hypothetical protein